MAESPEPSYDDSYDRQTHLEGDGSVSLGGKINPFGVEENAAEYDANPPDPLDSIAEEAVYAELARQLGETPPGFAPYEEPGPDFDYGYEEAGPDPEDVIETANITPEEQQAVHAAFRAPPRHARRSAPA
jgi:hypothetical protein